MTKGSIPDNFNKFKLNNHQDHSSENYEDDVMEEDYDDYFHKNEVEEYVQVRDSEQSCHILPVNNTKFHDACSQYEDDEVESVLEEDDEDESARNGNRNDENKPRE